MAAAECIPIEDRPVLGLCDCSIFMTKTALFAGIAIQECVGQGAGAFDLGDHREGQLSGEFRLLY